ncbi:MAG: hypothetical protein COZ80_11745 [Ignavibacteria bacterium CG_4_8_14_3_um_filter_37_9]|nr:hypothetical protein [Ignavibacteria bacterium]OIO14078.1 MAG: hypothetical protein AUJ54_14995 [Ignavibacteria bacterium CG1_02_37_35]PIP79006.1 MAG: hypothetical protein COW85_02450 [Ignavibacteria bacterium CG22_combo_CG10-13_8_21_14_all_37_15]PIS45278.1 MAG: hypothetical protein COT22_06085 [Ignavibacteria bacterium CG08_land_8_20_14_0_20_37_9]PIW98224.1 MAG: hypothetical protein COZ80_11745 [Ignavibacteria bacterium CG_4_8_14_3_um_filter_37_9]PIX92945.1 MAG: hypothetical protein COZ25_
MDEKYLDVLQNIEFGIVSVYQKQNDLKDYEVMNALDALIDNYRFEIRGYTPKEYPLTDKEILVFKEVREMCEFRLGRKNLDETGLAILEQKTTEEILSCLRKIRKSVERWNSRGGKQGYLNFVKEYVS